MKADLDDPYKFTYLWLGFHRDMKQTSCCVSSPAPTHEYKQGGASPSLTKEVKTDRETDEASGGEGK